MQQSCNPARYASHPAFGTGNLPEALLDRYAKDNESLTLSVLGQHRDLHLRAGRPQPIVQRCERQRVSMSELDIGSVVGSEPELLGDGQNVRKAGFAAS